MKYIITEQQNIKLQLSRRLAHIDEFMLNNALVKSRRIPGICLYDSRKFLDAVIAEICEMMYDFFFSNLDDLSPEWSMLYDMIDEYVRTNHGRDIAKFYKRMCL